MFSPTECKPTVGMLIALCLLPTSTGAMASGSQSCLSMLKGTSQEETTACALTLVNSRHNGCHDVPSGAIWQEHTQGLHEL